MESILYALLGTQRVERISQQPYYLYCVHTAVMVNEEQGKEGVRYDRLCADLAAHEYRNTIILNIIINNLHRKFIVLTRVAEHVEMLSRLFTQHSIAHDTLYGKKQSYRDSPVLIGTLSKIGVGFDEANACPDFQGIKSDCVILCHSIKQRGAFEQARGRVMRAAKPVVVWLQDQNAIPKRHLRGLTEWIQHTHGTVRSLQYRPGSIILPPAEGL
jgi:hypothetical protein